MNVFGGTPVGAFGGAVFTLLLAAACMSDLRSRRIPNALVLGLLIAGVGYSLATKAPLAAFEHAFAGVAVGLGIWLPFWMLRVLGAGDVKLIAASGAWLGAAAVVEASLLGAVAGGFLAFWALARHGGWVTGARRFGVWMLASRTAGTVLPELTPQHRRIPYGLAIAAGVAVAAWLPGLIW